MTPASPMIGSTITIAVFLEIARFIASESPKGTCLTPLRSGLNGLRFEGWPVNESAPIVRP